VIFPAAAKILRRLMLSVLYRHFLSVVVLKCYMQHFLQTVCVCVKLQLFGEEWYKSNNRHYCKLSQMAGQSGMTRHVASHNFFLGGGEESNEQIWGQLLTVI